MPQVHLFGIRHHGPGSARSLKHALERLRPEAVLIEGPPDANDLIELARHPDLKPPVALLIYLPQSPSSAVLYPFAEYSPEWQAMQYALKHTIPVRFIDLPQSARLQDCSEKPGGEEEASDSTPEVDEESQPEPPRSDTFTEDPLAPMARAAGYSDAERWWDHLVESRAGHDLDVFKAVHEMMSAVRAELTEPLSVIEAQREAYMRKCLRAAIAEGYENIAVVCGAWHTPALENLPSAKSDDALLKGLPRAKTAAAWTPWSYERLSFRSGYGAGIDSPVWYELLWSTREALGAQWLTRAARLLREQDIPVSSAHVIEACRLAETLAALRGRPVPGLAEYNDAAESVLSSGSTVQLQLIAKQWHYGERLGVVPESFPAAPLQQDVTAQQKRLRLPPKLEIKTPDLDLRETLDRERSHLLRRLRLLGVHWGEPKAQTSGRGTFHELWDLGWRPEFAIALIEAGRFGHTVEQAATGQVAERSANPAASLTSLIAALEDALFANLPGAIGSLVAAIEARAAVSTDASQLLEALLPLVNVFRYGNVRATDVSLVAEILKGLVPRIFVAGPGAAAHIDDEAARKLWQHFMDADRALAALNNEEYSQGWREMLKRVAGNDASNSLLAGYAHRLLYDAGEIEFEALSMAFSRALSLGTEPAIGAHWVEGLLSTSGAVLIHDDRLRNLIAGWVRTTSEEHFVQVLPLVRRTFANFPAPERRQIGERLRPDAGSGMATATTSDFDIAAAHATLPVLKRIWNLPE